MALALSRHREFGDMAARLQNNLGHLKRQTGKANEALELLEQALVFFSDVSPNEFWASAVLFMSLSQDEVAVRILMQDWAVHHPAWWRLRRIRLFLDRLICLNARQTGNWLVQFYSFHRVDLTGFQDTQEASLVSMLRQPLQTGIP